MISQSDTKFGGSIPRLYHDCLRRLFFEPYAEDLARRVSIGPGSRVLELACGTGILTAALTDRLHQDVAVTATDLNPGMIEIAKTHAASRVEWRIADATALPFDDESFDLAVCQFGVMFFPNKVTAARQVARVLRPGGTFLFNTWGTLDDNPVARVTYHTVTSLFPSNPPAFYQVPFGYCDRAQIEADFLAGGFASVAIETVDREGWAASARTAAIGLVQGTPLANAIHERGGMSVDAVTHAVATAVERQFGSGEVRVPQRAYVVTART